jgi:hypothetical protein
MKPIHTIFYSWQSDLPKETNFNAIRQSLRAASNLVESEIDNTRIDVDEATRNTTGSPNIPKTIFYKISASDIFICDLTTINTEAPSEFRRVPNPNVLIELGYAISTLGWDRIIMVFNTVHGTFPDDLPFDIDRHRSTPFSIKDKKDNSGKGNLSQVLKVAIQAIIEKAPLKPDEKRKEKPEENKRNIDVRNLKWALNTIHIPTFDHFLEEIPDRIIGKIFYFKDSFVPVLESNTFHIYDQELFKRLQKFKDNWNKSLSFYQHYGPDSSGNNYRFHLVMDTFENDKARKDFNTISKIRLELEKDFKDLLQFIRENYLEIDLNETSKNAFESYKADIETE